MNKIPKSFVMRSGIVGTSVTALVRDVRRVLEPNTASHLRVSLYNRGYNRTCHTKQVTIIGT